MHFPNLYFIQIKINFNWTNVVCFRVLLKAEFFSKNNAHFVFQMFVLDLYL